MRIESFCALVVATFLSTAALPAQQSANTAANDELKAVFARIDKTSAGFHSAEANFEWDEYTKVVDETDTEQGKVYFRKQGGEVEMAADVEPAPATDVGPTKKGANGHSSAQKFILFSAGKVQIYQPANDHLDVYSAGKNREAVESFLVLGFGGSSQQMLRSFDVTYGGQEKIDGTDTDKLELVPKSDKVKEMFDHIELWIDSRGISIQQKLISPEGDYRLNKYSNIVLDKKLSDNVFKLRTNGKTSVETH